MNKNKPVRLETSLRRHAMIRVCVMVEDTVSQIMENPATSKKVRAQAKKAYRWCGECLACVGIKSERDTRLSSGAMREYAALAGRINAKLLDLPENQREGAHYMLVWTLIMDVSCALKEYRVDCVRRIDQTFGTLTKMILGGNNPDDFPAAEAGTNIYMEVA